MFRHLELSNIDQIVIQMLNNWFFKNINCHVELFSLMIPSSCVLQMRRRLTLVLLTPQFMDILISNPASEDNLLCAYRSTATDPTDQIYRQNNNTNNSAFLHILPTKMLNTLKCNDKNKLRCVILTSGNSLVSDIQNKIC